jgi:hypothetical protein
VEFKNFPSPPVKLIRQTRRTLPDAIRRIGFWYNKFVANMRFRIGPQTLIRKIDGL